MINSSKKTSESLYLSDKRDSIILDSRYPEITVINTPNASAKIHWREGKAESEFNF